LKNLLIIASFLLTLVAPDLVVANIPVEYRQRPVKVSLPRRSKPLKAVRGWMTHYYGPKPGQKHYQHGSYRKDVKINGKGVRTASGTKPISGKTISVNFEVFPEGAVLRITNLKTGKSFIGIAEDTGETMNEYQDGSWIDRFTGHGDSGLAAAKSEGKQPVLIEMLSKPKKHQRRMLVASR
jgi:3D (Asp-Asp-Asp) domain-containing protein